MFRLHKLALELRPFLPLCYFFGFGGAGMTLFLLFRDTATSSQLLSVVLGLTVWALLLFAFIRLFQSIPPPVLPGDSFFVRFWSRCKLALYHLLVFAVLVMGLALATMSLKLVSISAG